MGMAHYETHLEFKMRLTNGPTRALQEGTLTLFYDKGEEIVYRATSGCCGWQFIGSQSAKGKGPIPDMIMRYSTPKYWVLTKPVMLPHIKGVEGAFYPIQPFAVTYEGVQRGDFGIHYDANLPGSAGCVVLRNKSGFDGFVRRMTEFGKQGIERLELDILYGKPAMPK